MEQLLLDILPEPEPDFDNFIVGNNRISLETLKILPRGRAAYLWGPPGSGRTHLLRAAAEEPQAVYLTADTAASRLPVLAHDDSVAVSLVAVDDADRLNHDGQAALFSLFNRWQTAAGSAASFSILSAGPCAPRMLQLREDLRTRLGWDLVFRLEPLSDSDKFSALQELADKRGLQIPDDVLHWLLRHQSRNMGQLTALIAALDSFSLRHHRAITLPLLKMLLAQRGSKPNNPDSNKPATCT